MLLNTHGFSGKIDKAIKVTTNDPDNTKIQLKLIGEVRKLAKIEPERIKLKGSIGEKISQTVTIDPGTEETLNIVKVSSLKGTDIRYTLEEIESSGKKAYRLIVENIKETEGRYKETITINTDRSDLPPLTIPVSGDIKKSMVESNKTEDNPPASADTVEQK